MSQIQYTWKVIFVDESAGIMHVEYTAAGYPTQRCSMPLPTETEKIEDAVARGAPPVAHWEEMKKPRAAVTVGAAGQGVATTPTPAAPIAGETPVEATVL